MPYVTEEIYQKLPIKEADSIMVSTYPIYRKEEIFDYEAEKLNYVLEDIVAIRNLKATNKITKDAFVSIQCSKELAPIYFSQLKIKEEQIVTEELEGKVQAPYQSTNIQITYYFEAEKVDDSLRYEEIRELEASIARREKLLANENYINKAPITVVEQDRKKLAEEKERLQNLKN